MVLRTSLRYFLAVARHGSMRMAAEELNVAQSAISRRIQTLEEELGAQLLVRTSRGVLLSEIGSRLVASLTPVVDGHRALADEIREYEKLNRGHVRVGAIESMLPDVLPQVLRRFMADHPNITFHVTVETTPTVVQMVRNGDVDLGIAFSPSRDPEIETVFQAPEPLFAVVAPGHPLTLAKQVTVSEVARWPVAVQLVGSNLRTMFDNACRAAGISVQPALETNSLELLHRFAQSGAGTALLLRHTVIGSARRGLVVPRRFHEASLAGVVEIFVLRGRALPRASRVFIAALGRALRPE